MISGITLLMLAIIGGIFMFFMRQTIIVMSRHIEFDQKNEIYQHYQQLDTSFYKSHSTGDLMSRMAEDVSRVRMYTGPAIMYLVKPAGHHRIQPLFHDSQRCAVHLICSGALAHPGGNHLYGQ